MVLEFFMTMKPPTITNQEHKVMVRNGKPVFYDPPELKAARSKLISHLGKHVPHKKMDGPIELVTKWCFPIKGEHSDGDYKTSKPDTDNLQKLLKDCMTKLGFWKDDALVCSEICQKFWAKIPGIFICVEELPKNGYTKS